MSFRKFGGLQFASKHNAVASYYNTSNNLLVSQNVGQSNSYINFLSDISGNQIFGNVYISGNLTCANITQTSVSKGYVNIPSTSVNINVLSPFLNSSAQAAEVTFSTQGIYLVIGFISGLKPTQTQNGYQMSITIQNTNTNEYLWTNGCQYYGDGSNSDGVYLQAVGYVYRNNSDITVQLINSSDFEIDSITGGAISWIKIG